MSNQIQQLCDAPAGQPEVLQGNIAFAVGCVRGGIHCADGYPGTPSSEVIDKGLSEVQDLHQGGLVRERGRGLRRGRGPQHRRAATAW